MIFRQGDLAFYKKYLYLALPIAANELLGFSLHFADKTMISHVGELELASVHLSGQLTLIFLLTMFGTTTSAGIFSAQYFGEKNVQGVRKSLGLAVILTCCFSSVFVILTSFFAENLVSFWSDRKEHIELGASYLKYAGISFFFSGISIAYTTILCSIKKAYIPTIVKCISISLNILLNWVFIFGNWGAPAMGVEGAGLATLLARIVEMILTIGLTYHFKTEAAGSLKELLGFDKPFIRKYVSIFTNTLITDLGWALGFTFYQKLYAAINSDAVTIIAAVDPIGHFFILFYLATAQAGAVLLGNSIGEQQYDRAKEDSKRVLRFTVLMSFISTAMIVIGADYAVLLFDINPTLQEKAAHILLLFAILFPFKLINIHVIAGILRSGGDTRYAMWIDLIGVYGVGIPIGCIAVYFFNLPLEVVYILIGSEEIIKALAGLHRVYSGKWVNRVIS